MSEKEPKDRERLVTTIADMLNDATYKELMCMYYFLIS